MNKNIISILLSIFSIPIAWLIQLSRILSFMDNYNGDLFISIVIVINTISIIIALRKREDSK